MAGDGWSQDAPLSKWRSIMGFGDGTMEAKGNFLIKTIDHLRDLQ
jgi:hypothetical protein